MSPEAGATHTEIITVINQVGLPIALVVVMLYFIGKYFWPFFTDMIRTLQEEREHSKDMLVKMNEMFHATLTRIHDEIIKRLDQIIERLNGKGKHE